MTDVDRLAVALVVLVLASGCISPSVAGPDSTSTTTAPTTAAPTSSTTTEATSTASPTTTTERDLAGYSSVDVEVGTIRNATNTTRWLNITVPAEYVWIQFYQVPFGNTSFAVATNCSEYREPFAMTIEDTPHWEIATNHTHNVSEWTTVRVANVDAGQVVAERTVNDVEGECSPPLPEPENASKVGTDD